MLEPLITYYVGAWFWSQNPRSDTEYACLKNRRRKGGRGPAAGERDGSWTSISCKLQAGIANARIPQGRKNPTNPEPTAEAGVGRISDKKKKFLTNALRFTFTAFGVALALTLVTPNPANTQFCLSASAGAAPVMIRP